MKPRDIGVGVAVALVWSVVFAGPIADRLQGLGIDNLYRLRDSFYSPKHTPESSPAVIVAIDEESYQSAPFRGTPKVLWTRQIAAVLDAIFEAEVQTVGFDIVFATSVEPHMRGFDRDLLRTLRAAARRNRIVLGLIQHREKPIVPYLGYQVVVGRHRNLRPLNVVTDPDGVIRRVPMYFKQVGANKSLLPSMSLEMAMRATGKQAIVAADGGVSLGDYRIPGQLDPHIRVGPNAAELQNNVAVRFDKHLSTIPTYSLADLLQCAKSDKRQAFFRKHFAGKAVMFGTVLDEEDRIPSSIRFLSRTNADISTPRCIKPVAVGLRTAFDRETIPGIYLQATAINNFVRGEALRELPRWLSWLATTGGALVLAFVTIAAGPLVSVLALFGAALLWTIAATATFAGGLVLPLFQPAAAASLTLATLLGYRFAIADRMGRHIRHAFSHYLAPAVVDQLVEDNRMPEQGGELRSMTVWISDLEKYSTITEHFEPPKLVDLLNTVYTEMSDTIEEYQGFVAQFVGDAVVGAFGAPLEDIHHADNAVLSAIACVRRVAELNETVDLPGELRLRIRVGISSGDLVVGNIGSQRRLSYAIVGDDINLSSRLEGASKVYGTQVLANEETVKLCSPELAFREIDLIKVLGKDNEVRIFEPLGLADTLTGEQRADLDVYAQALAIYRKGEFSEAAAAFATLAERDPAADHMAKRCETYQKKPPDPDWDGIFVLDSK